MKDTHQTPNFAQTQIPLNWKNEMGFIVVKQRGGFKTLVMEWPGQNNNLISI